jgi:tetratricopeptide (TPR) repeat protein
LQEEAVSVSVPETITVDCHAFGLYPYVGCNELMRQLFPDIRRDRPDLVRESVRSLVILAPDIHAQILEDFPDLVGVMGEPGTIPFTWGQRDEGLHALDRATWLAHGVVSLILRWRSGLTGAPLLRLAFTNLASADPLQAQFVQILARRADAGVLQVIRVDGGGAAEGSADAEEGGITDAAGGTRGVAAAHSPEEHRVRAEQLMALGRRSLDLSSVLHHLERSTAPTHVTLRVFTEAAEHYLAVGFYEAALHTARTAALFTSPDDGITARTLCKVTVYSLLLLGRLDEADAFCADQLSTSADPLAKMTCAYAMALLRARMRPADKRDFQAAAEFMELAIRHVKSVPQGPEEVGNRIFLNHNFRALLTMRAGRLDEALLLMEKGLAELRRLCPERCQAESPIFLQNRAKLHMAMKQPELAVASYTEMVELEPFSVEPHFLRGNAHRARGDHRAALADYLLAVEAGPARPEIHFNAGLACTAIDDAGQALGEYALALDLDPGYVSARLNRVALLYQAGRLAEAAQDAEAGLRADPRHPDLLCARGLVSLTSGNLQAALADFSEALTYDPSHAAALKNRSSTLFAMGNVPDALRDADRCLAVRPDAAGYLNRGYLHQSKRAWRQALADYQRAARYDNVDRTVLARRRATCIRSLAEEAAGLPSRVPPGPAIG